MADRPCVDFVAHQIGKPNQKATLLVVECWTPTHELRKIERE